MSASLIIKNTKDGERFAVEFDKDGRKYRTLFTSLREEACAWGRNVQTHGWAMEGRPIAV